MGWRQAVKCFLPGPGDVHSTLINERLAFVLLWRKGAEDVVDQVAAR
jgi:hypothetical protein